MNAIADNEHFVEVRYPRGSVMRPSWYRYVELARVDDMAESGWRPIGEPLHVPHGCYSILMEWMGEGEPE